MCLCHSKAASCFQIKRIIVVYLPSICHNLDRSYMKSPRILLLGLMILLTSCSTLAPLFGKHKSVESAALPAKGQIKQIALLLPLKGGLAKKAETVRDG